MQELIVNKFLTKNFDIKYLHSLLIPNSNLSRGIGRDWVWKENSTYNLGNWERCLAVGRRRRKSIGQTT